MDTIFPCRKKNNFLTYRETYILNENVKNLINSKVINKYNDGYLNIDRYNIIIFI